MADGSLNRFGCLQLLEGLPELRVERGSLSSCGGESGERSCGRLLRRADRLEIERVSVLGELAGVDRCEPLRLLGIGILDGETEDVGIRLRRDTRASQEVLRRFEGRRCRDHLLGDAREPGEAHLRLGHSARADPAPHPTPGILISAKHRRS